MRKPQRSFWQMPSFKLQKPNKPEPIVVTYTPIDAAKLVPFIDLGKVPEARALFYRQMDELNMKED